MRRVLDLRITHWGWKLGYVIAAYVVTLAPVWIAPPLEPIRFVARLASTLLLLGAYLLGARIFRGKGEPVGPPRPWWQMTARAKLYSVLIVVENGVLAFLYLNSGVRLRRRGESTPPAPLTPTFKPKRLPIR